MNMSIIIHNTLASARAACVAAAQLPHTELDALSAHSDADDIVAAAITVSARTRDALRRENGAVDEPAQPGDAAQLAAYRALTHLIRGVRAAPESALDHAARAASEASHAQSAAMGLDAAQAENLGEAAYLATMRDLGGAS